MGIKFFFRRLLLVLFDVIFYLNIQACKRRSFKCFIDVEKIGVLCGGAMNQAARVFL